jgi:hypothetical protein
MELYKHLLQYIGLGFGFGAGVGIAIALISGVVIGMLKK